MCINFLRTFLLRGKPKMLCWLGNLVFSSWFHVPVFTTNPGQLLFTLSGKINFNINICPNMLLAKTIISTCMFYSPLNMSPFGNYAQARTPFDSLLYLIGCANSTMLEHNIFHTLLPYSCLVLINQSSLHFLLFAILLAL